MMLDKVYELLEKHLVGIDVYSNEAIDEIAKYLDEHKYCYEMGTELHSNMEGGVCAVALFYRGQPRLIMFEYKF